MQQLVWETAEELDQKLAQRVRNIRKRRSISQEKLASMSGVSYGSIKRFETTGMISLLSLTKIAMALDMADELRDIFTSVPDRDIQEVINETIISKRKQEKIMSYITTYTGNHFDPINPDPELINIVDIAHALPMICRGNGQVSTFWSVGEHCILCAKEAAARGYSNRVIEGALLHDASECYMSDVPRPLKQFMTVYKEQENHLLDVLYTKFLGSPLNEQEEQLIKEIDDAVLWYDMKYLLGEDSEGDKPETCMVPEYTVRAFKDVEQEYLEIFEKYKVL